MEIASHWINKSSATDIPRPQGRSVPHLVQTLLNDIGEQPMREGLIKTPERFEKAFRELTTGYQMTAAQAVGEGVFAAEGRGLVAVNGIEFFSLCEHHLLPFWGQASIAYWPGEKILGLSKLARVVDVFARRLQVQERLTREIADSICELVGARAVAVRVEAQHMCMMMRGVKKNQSTTRSEHVVGYDNLESFEKDRLWKALEQQNG